MSGIARRRRKSGMLVLRYAIAISITLIFLFPVYWLFMISFKTPDEIFHVPPLWAPGKIQFSNYWVLFRDGDVLAIWNSLVVAGISSAMAMLLGTFCAYSLARFNTGGENLAMWIISQRMIPPIAVVFPIFLIYVYFGMVDTAAPLAVFVAIVLSLIPHDMQYGPQAALIAEAFTPRLRYSGASLGYQLASIIAGGPAPLIATALFATYHSGYAISIYIAACAVVSIVATALMPDYTNKDISEEHDRP